MADGRLGQLPRVLVLQAMAAVRRSDWNVALPAIDEARRLATETRQVIWAGAADAIAGLAAAMRGEEDQAEGLAADAERVVSPLGVTFVLVTVQMARGAAALGAGRHVDAVAHLRRLFTAGDPAYHWTMRWWALADLVEAAVRAHQRELVEPLITKLSRWPPERRRSGCARCCATLGRCWPRTGMPRHEVAGPLSQGGRMR
jgi:hypothetical protein